ncbi:DNA primase small subunit, putative [Entamoeba histolytica]
MNKVSQSLSLYYQKFFPSKLFYQWVTRNGKYSQTRELAAFKTNSFFNRYLHFNSSYDLSNYLSRYVPERIEIGPIFDHLLFNKTNTATMREFVIDIDIDDYDDIRYCCSSTQVCKKCWILMSCAAKVIHHIFQEQFGMKHILNVFSGRRGIHFWICDEQALHFNEQMRTYITKYFSLFTNQCTNKDNHPIIDIHEEYPLYNEVYQILEPYFEDYCEKQEIFKIEQRKEQLLNLLPQNETSQVIRKFNNLSWTLLKEHFKNNKTTLMSIVFTYLYPRIDTNVSVQLNHLLKAPFCIHPSTNKVCIPINFNTIDSFDPNKVPTLQSLQESKLLSFYSFNDSIELFSRFVKESIQ